MPIAKNASVLVHGVHMRMGARNVIVIFMCVPLVTRYESWLSTEHEGTPTSPFAFTRPGALNEGCCFFVSFLIIETLI